MSLQMHPHHMPGQQTHGFDPESGQVPESKVSPPPIDDPALFVKHENVPIFDAHEHPIKGDITEDYLWLLAHNTNRRRMAEGLYPQVTIGHMEEGKTEGEQPKLVGYLGETRVGKHNGRPALLGDVHYRKDDHDEAMTYPHRSIELHRSNASPENNYVWSLACTRRKPERELGMVTYEAQPKPANDFRIVRYAFDAPSEGADETPSHQPQPRKGSVMDFDSPEFEAKMMEIVDRCVRKIIEDAPEEEIAKHEDTGVPPAPQAEPPTGGQEIDYEAAQPGGDNTFVPKLLGKGKKVEECPEGEKEEKYRRTPGRTGDDSEIVKYRAEVQTLKTENSALKSKLQTVQDQTDELMIKYQADEVDQMLSKVKAEHNVIFDYDVEHKRLLGMPRDQRPSHIDIMQVHYRKSSVGAGPILMGKVQNGFATQIPPEEKQAFYDFCTRNRITDVAVGREKYLASKNGH